MFARSRAGMARLAAVSLVALVLPGSAAAEGVNLVGNHCFGEGTGAPNMSFACNTNSGTNVMIGSFVLDVNKREIIGYEAVLDLASFCTIAGECADHPTYANVARIRVAAAGAQENNQDLGAGTEYFAFNLLLNNAKTVGTGSCGGCEVPVCIVFNSINTVPRGTFGSRKLTTPQNAGSNYITWQGGGVPVVGPVVGCPAATASRRSAWGAVKALYR